MRRSGESCKRKNGCIAHAQQFSLLLILPLFSLLVISNSCKVRQIRANPHSRSRNALGEYLDLLDPTRIVFDTRDFTLLTLSLFSDARDTRYAPLRRPSPTRAWGASGAVGKIIGKQTKEIRFVKFYLCVRMHHIHQEGSSYSYCC